MDAAWTWTQYTGAPSCGSASIRTHIRLVVGSCTYIGIMTSDAPDASSAGISPGRRNRTYTGAMTEAWSPIKSSIPASAIANAIAARWNEEDSSAVEILAPTLVYLRQHRLLEGVFDDAAAAREALEMLSKVRKTGVEVAVILPLTELGRAHEELWGTGLILYGWVEHDGTVRFTGPEVA